MITDEMRSYRNTIKYKIESMDIIFENGDIEPIDSGMIMHIYMEKDYDSLYFPIFNVSAVMSDELYNRINKENETVQFRLKIIKNIYDLSNKLQKYELYCNKLFRCFMDKETIIKIKNNLKIRRLQRILSLLTLDLIQEIFIYLQMMLLIVRRYLIFQ